MTTLSIPGREQLTPTWRDSTLSTARRVEELLRAMTLEEKVAQLGSRWAGNDMLPPDAADPGTTFNVAPLQDVFAASGSVSLEDASATASATSPVSSAACRSRLPKEPPRSSASSGWCSPVRVWAFRHSSTRSA